MRDFLYVIVLGITVTTIILALMFGGLIALDYFLVVDHKEPLRQAIILINRCMALERFTQQECVLITTGSQP